MIPPFPSLRRLSRILDDSVWCYRHHFWYFFSCVLIVYIPWFVVLFILLKPLPWYEYFTLLHITSSHVDSLSLVFHDYTGPFLAHPSNRWLLLLIQNLLLSPMTMSHLIDRTAHCLAYPRTPPKRLYPMLTRMLSLLSTLGTITLCATLAHFLVLTAVMTDSIYMSSTAWYVTWGEPRFFSPFWLLAAGGVGLIAFLLSLSPQAILLDDLPLLAAWQRSRTMVWPIVWHLIALHVFSMTITYSIARSASWLLLVLFQRTLIAPDYMSIGIECLCVLGGWMLSMPLVPIGLTMLYVQASHGFPVPEQHRSKGA